MAQCPRCSGTGKVLSSQNPFEPNKVSTGWGTHRCTACNGQGVVQGAAGAGGGQQLGQGCMAAFTGLFLHPVFAFVGFWLIATILLLLLGSVAGFAMGFDMNEPPGLFFVSGMVLSAGVTWALRIYVHRLMKWTFFLLIGGLTLAIIAGIVKVLMERSASG